MHFKFAISGISGVFVPGAESDADLAWVKRMVLRYVEKGPYRLHPDDVLVRNVLEGLARNRARYGRAYCPCRPVTGDREIDKANICPCRNHRADIARDGTCECGIFVSEEHLKALTSRRSGCSEATS